MEKKKHSEMTVAISGAIVGALVSGVIAVIIFFAGNYSTQATLEKKTVETLAGYFDGVDLQMSYKQALQIIYENSKALKNEYQKGYSQAQIDFQEEAGQKYLDGYEKGKDEAEASKYQEGYDAGLIAGNTADMQAGSVIAPVSNQPGKYLTDVAPAYQSTRYEHYSSKDSGNVKSFSMAGKKYFDGFTWNAGYESFSIHTLDGKYTEINGILGHVDTKDMNNTTLLIFFDGKLHQEIPLSGDMIAKPFTINVTGVNQLKFVLPQASGYPVYGYAEVIIR